MNHTSNPQVKDVKPDIQWLKNMKNMFSGNSNTITEDAKLVATDSFTCKVSNAVSSMTSDPVTQTCIDSKSSKYYSVVSPALCLRPLANNGMMSQIIF